MAIENYQKALKMNEEIGDKRYMAQTTGNIGSIYVKQKNYVMAIENYRQALKINEEIGSKAGVANDLSNLGGVYISIVQDTIQANPKWVHSVRVTTTNEITAKKYQSDGTIPSGKTALLHKGIDYLQQGLAIGKEIHAQDILKMCYEALAVAYKLNGDYKNALENFQQYTVVKDSVFSLENDKKILKLGMESEYQVKRAVDSIKSQEVQQISAVKLQHQRNYTYFGMAGIVLLLGFSFFIAKERRKSENLLLNILPAEVAGELKSKGVSKAKHFDHVTVMLSDFVSFAKVSERLSPQELVDELHACFKAFDEITGKYHIEKIKTIGDAYLAVCGLPVTNPKHAENIVSAAIEIAAFMFDRHEKMGDKTFEIRIGVHSGSVVAGIVGIKKFAYDIWGDTVNIVARMEQNSKPGRINISQSTYELVKDKFACEYRGEIEAKNKGQLKMYFVSSAVASA